MAFSLRLSYALVPLLAACSTGGTDPPRRDLSVAVDAGQLDAKMPGLATACGPRTAPVRLSNLPGEHQYPRVSFTGTSYLVAWNTETVEQTGLVNRIDAQLVDGDGQKLGPNLPMSPSSIADQSPPSVAPVTNGTAIAWARRDGKGSTNIVLSTLDNNGQKLSSTGAACLPDKEDCGIVEVTDSGRATYPYLGRPVLTERTAVPTDNVVSLAWLDTRNYPCPPQGCLNLNDVYWKKLQAGGTELIPERRLTPVGANRRHANPRMAFDGASSGVVYRDDTAVLYTDFYFTAVDLVGLVSTSPTKIGSAAGKGLQVGGPDMIYADSAYALVSIAGSTGSANVVFQRLQSNGQSALLPRGVSFTGIACTPTVAFNGEFYGIAWQTDCSLAGSALAFVLVDKQGVRMKADGTSCIGSFDDTCGVQIIVPAEAGLSSFPELVWSGNSNFGLVWMERQGREAGQADANVMFTEIDCKAL